MSTTGKVRKVGKSVRTSPAAHDASGSSRGSPQRRRSGTKGDVERHHKSPSTARNGSSSGSLERKAPSRKKKSVLEELRAHYSAIKDLSVSNFMLRDTLGTGTFGRVRLVSYNYNSKVIYLALKMLRKSEVIRLKQVEHINSEKRILIRLAHPFIVNMYSHFKDKDFLYMVMEYVIGGEVFSLLRRVGRFNNSTAMFYSAEIVCALAYLHSHSVVYRDLKPENLLIGRDGHIKLTDFGFAKIVKDRTWTLCGTPEYLAPEIITSKGHGKAADWWALGVLIFEMLAGYPPFYDESQYGIYQKILGGEIKFPRSMNKHARDLISKLLTADRTKRYGCMKNGVEDIKNHPWFQSIDWEKCERRQLRPPYIPRYKFNGDTSNFEKYDEEDKTKHVELTAEQQKLFDNF